MNYDKDEEKEKLISYKGEEEGKEKEKKKEIWIDQRLKVNVTYYY